MDLFHGGHCRLDEPATAGSDRVSTDGKPIILLCGCPDVTQCHRKLLADRLAQAWSEDVVHLTPPDKNAQPGQATLF
jgi:hypothetical protein